MWSSLRVLLMIGASEAAAPVAGGAGHASFFTWTKPNTIGLLYNNIPTEAISLEYWMKVTDPHMTQMGLFTYSCCTSPPTFFARAPPRVFY
jgi:hypothetical protein